MRLPRTLYARLTAVFLLFLLVLGALCLWLVQRSAELRALEFTQRLNAPIAMYMAEQPGLVDAGGLHGEVLAELAPHVMMINPSVEVYLLDGEGRVVGQAPEANTIAPIQVDTKPIEQFLMAGANFPLFGDNPKNREETRIFSAAPVHLDGHLKGYVYVVLASEQYRSLLESLQGSYSTRTIVLTLSGVLILSLLGGALVFFMLTRRLQALTRRVNQWCHEEPVLQNGWGLDIRTDKRSMDELDELNNAYQCMAARLSQQNRALQDSDRSRRDLMASISHDLRTPLTALQGYLETLLLKAESLPIDQRNHYLSIAHRHSQRLRELVSQLFELSKLSSAGFQLHTEPFSMLELAHDCAQDYALVAEERGVSITVATDHGDSDALEVLADIALVQRVLQNLLDNALCFTPPQGRIDIRLLRSEGSCVQIDVEDTGCGMDSATLARIFEPCYSARSQERHMGIEPNAGHPVAPHSTGQNTTEPVAPGTSHAGLGLSIVERIVILHGGKTGVYSTLGHGTCFRFTLPCSAGLAHPNAV